MGTDDLESKITVTSFQENQHQPELGERNEEAGRQNPEFDQFLVGFLRARPSHTTPTIKIMRPSKVT